MALTIACVATASANPGAVFENYSPEIWKGDGELELKYRVRRPDRVEDGKKYPLVLLLHGAGGRGDDNLGQIKDAGGGAALDRMGVSGKFGAYVMAGQVPKGKLWVDVPWSTLDHEMPKVSESMQMMLAALDAFVADAKNQVDPKRIYVIGLSMGGYGTWDAIQRRPDLFAGRRPDLRWRRQTPGEKDRQAPDLGVARRQGRGDQTEPFARHDRRARSRRRRAQVHRSEGARSQTCGWTRSVLPRCGSGCSSRRKSSAVTCRSATGRSAGWCPRATCLGLRGSPSRGKPISFSAIRTLSQSTSPSPSRQNPFFLPQSLTSSFTMRFSERADPVFRRGGTSACCRCRNTRRPHGLSNSSM